MWVAALQDLERQSILDRTLIPDLEILSTSDIINLIKRLINGPKTWTSLQNSLGDAVAAVYKEITLHPTIQTGPGIVHQVNDVKLLPSGRYVLFNNLRTLECWRVDDGTLIWTHPPAQEHAGVLEFAAEELVGQGSVVIMICNRTLGDRPNRKK